VRLGVHAGDKLLVAVRRNAVVIRPRPRSWAKALRGLGKQRYPKGYLKKERDSWD
jgi:hypothetical protein